MWDAETGGALLVIDVGDYVKALVFFVEPAWARRSSLLLVAMIKVRVFDPIAGGEALLVIEVGSDVNALEFFTEPRLRAAGCMRLVEQNGARRRPGRWW